MKLPIILITSNIFVVLALAANGQNLKAKLENQISGWSTLNFSDPLRYQFGGRYIPTLSLSDSLKNNRIFDAEVSINTFANASFEGKNYGNGSTILKPYRLWLRYAFPRLEFRIGLQKISFGSASILRPLMWFDKIDIRDPLQLTDGVYSFLARYYFQNNANIWFWALYGNKETKGWEIVPTQKQTPEIGGRIQLPTPKGEIALSYHHRRADYTIPFDSIPGDLSSKYPEDRIGVDGKWDFGVGLWFEAVIKHSSRNNTSLPEWESYLNLGMDYTFAAGNGLNAITEYFRYNARDHLTGNGLQGDFSVLSVNYPFGLLNNITAMVYYNWELNDWYRFISLQRKYNFLSLYLMVFWNPGQFNLYSISSDRNLFGGKGLQFMAVVNL